MPGSPLVSVVMSVFNGERFLAEAVDSILNQSFRDFEFIVINDGSTEGSGAILDSYQKKDSRLRVYHQDNRGLVESLNRGCSIARGKYIARMDADDISVRDRLMWQVEFMEKEPGVAVLGGAIESIDAMGKVLDIVQPATEDRELQSALLRQNSFAHSSVLMRRDDFVSVGGYRRAFSDAEDYDLWLRISDRFRLANLKSVILKYRIHPNQVCKLKLKQQTLSALAAQACALSRKKGGADPLGEIAEITPATLAVLGVSEVEQRRVLAQAYPGWIRNMSAIGEHSAALALAIEMLSDCNGADKRVVVDVRLAAAKLYWRERKFLRSMLFAGHALFERPVIAGRPLKKLIRRIRIVSETPGNTGVAGSN